MSQNEQQSIGSTQTHVHIELSVLRKIELFYVTQTLTVVNVFHVCCHEESLHVLVFLVKGDFICFDHQLLSCSSVGWSEVH